VTRLTRRIPTESLSETDRSRDVAVNPLIRKNGDRRNYERGVIRGCKMFRVWQVRRARNSVVPSRVTFIARRSSSNERHR